MVVYLIKGDGPFDRYALVYGEESNSYTFGALNLGDAGTPSILIDDLSPDTTYYIRVRPDNGCAPGYLSNEVSATTLSIEPMATIAPLQKIPLLLILKIGLFRRQ